MFGVLVKRAWDVEDLLVLFVLVTLGARLTNGDDNVFWPVAVILARPVSSYSIMATVAMVVIVVRAAVTVTSVVGAIIVAVRQSLSACILVKAYFGLLGIGVLIGGCNHLANPLRLIAIKLGAEVAVMESSDKGGDDL